MIVKFFAEDSTVYSRAMQIWMVLIGMAHNRQTVTYGALARTLGYTSPGAQFMTRLLDPVMRYCQDNNLPPLTVLVVNRETGKPGTGLSTLNDIDKDRELVFNHDWYYISHHHRKNSRKLTGKDSNRQTHITTTPPHRRRHLRPVVGRAVD